MILNREDWRFFLHENSLGCFTWMAYSRLFGLKGALLYLWAGVQDLFLYGGQACNRHRKYHCRKCRPGWTYAPDWSLGR